MTNSNGKATTVRKTFSRETNISINIKADSSILWALLTNSVDYPRWNSTIISIVGTIEPMGKIKLTSTLDPKRVFKLKVIEFQPEHLLIWGDAMGRRKYSLQRITANETEFSMTEKIAGPLFPLFASMIPPFDESFEKFAADLKKEAEAITSIK
jgi:hypothetical protein